MAQSPQQVLDFLDDLAARALPFARKDYDELCQFATAELGLPRLESWDLAYASEKLRSARYAFSDQEVKQFFPEEKVLQGMFRLVERLFGVSIQPDQAETWDPAVRFFRISDRDSRLIGQFYLDQYARDNKRDGAWMDEAISRRRLDASALCRRRAQSLADHLHPVAGHIHGGARHLGGQYRARPYRRRAGGEL
jgi:oligopeptidase A